MFLVCCIFVVLCVVAINVNYIRALCGHIVQLVFLAVDLKV